MKNKLFIMKQANGFRLLELVVVILGVLAAIAVPKFINLSDDADRAIFQFIAGPFISDVDQVHIAWLMRGNE